MIKGTRKLINKGKKDTELRNCLLELKDVLIPTDDLCVQRSDASRSVIKWGKKQTEVVTQLMENYAAYEDDVNSSTQEFSERYREFCAVWKDVLSEKKELNKCINLQTKAAARVDKLQKQKIRDDSRMDKENLDGGPGKTKKLENSLASASQELEEADALVDLKVLETQRELHKKLRQGYANVTKAAMDHLRREASVRERMINLLNEFPQVKDCQKTNNGNYEFTYKKYDSPAVVIPDWHRGEDIKDELTNKLSAKEVELMNERSQANELLNQRVGELQEELERRTNEHNLLLQKISDEAMIQRDNERDSFASSLSQKKCRV